MGMKDGYNKGRSKKNIVKEWSRMSCEQNRNECSGECEMPSYFDDCSDREKWPINPMTNDIDITYEELMATTDSECMKATRDKNWRWALRTNKKLQLCRGDY